MHYARGVRAGGRLQNSPSPIRRCSSSRGSSATAPTSRTRAPIMERANANIARMQQILYYPATAQELREFETRSHGDLHAESPHAGLSGKRLSPSIWTQHHPLFKTPIIRVSKKAGLRMWNNMVYQRGGLRSCGCKVIPVADGNRIGGSWDSPAPERPPPPSPSRNNSMRFRTTSWRCFRGKKSTPRKTAASPRLRATSRTSPHLQGSHLAKCVSGDVFPGRPRQGRFLRHLVHAERSRGLRMADVDAATTPAAWPRRLSC